MRAAYLLTICLTLIPDNLPATTFYVATTGTDVPTGGSAAAPFRTIGYGLERLQSGDTLIIGDGLYTDQANFINDGLHAIADGTPAANTLIRAANPFKVRIRNQGSTQYFDSPLRVRGNYIRVDGFVFELRDTTNTPMVGEIGGSYNRLTRSIFRLQGAVDTFGGWLYTGGHHQLIEDVAGVGAARYGFSAGGPDLADATHHVIYRRVVGRFDFSSSLQPKATFNAYGSNSDWYTHHIAYQNCIAIDGQRGPGPVGGSGEEHYAAWYFPKNMDVATISGSIALNNQVAYAGLFVQELQGRGTLLDNVVAWNNTSGVGVRWNGSGSANFNHLTVGAHTAGLYNGNSGSPAILRNSFFVTNNALLQTNSGFGEFSGSAFLPASQAFGTGVVTPSATLRYLPDATNSTGLTTTGAVILKRIGRRGTLWDEPGFDEVTAENLWPWPYENDIKTVFAEPNTPLAGNTPASNNTVRGFTVATDAFGQPMTLTRYIWQYLGQPIPPEIYASAPLFSNGFE
jgi:hypothetical protein